MTILKHSGIQNILDITIFIILYILYILTKYIKLENSLNEISLMFENAMKLKCIN